MKKQTKLVAVLSTASLLAIGASMTSFAATGWVEENGTWVYYDRNEERVTDQWARSGNGWYYLDENGEMAVDQLIDDGDNYYYVDTNGVMVTNQWVAIENEDAGEDDEPDHYWYYFQANGRAMTNGNNSRVALKTINGKRYAFDDEGRMLYGWVSEDDAERLDNTDGDAFLDGDYYFGDSDDGAMIAEWSLDTDETASRSQGGGDSAFLASGTTATSANPDQWTEARAEHAQYTQTWRYFNSVDDGARVTRGWFKVVAAEYLDSDRYDDDEEAWYYADGSGNLYAGEFRTINGRRFAFRNDGRCVFGLHFIKEETDGMDVKNDDDDNRPFEDEDEFDEVAPSYEQDGYKCYYFGETGDGPTDGSMRTGRTTVDLGGENFTFYFETSGGDRGAGVTGEQDNRYYQSGKLLSAGTDERFQVVQRTRTGTDPDNRRPIYSYTLLDDVDEFIAVVNSDEAPNSSVETVDLSDFAETDDMGDEFGISNLNQDAGDLDELYILRNTTTNAAGETRTSVGLDEDEFFLVNTSGRVVDNRGRSRDGNDYYFVTGSNGQILAVYLEN